MPSVSNKDQSRYDRIRNRMARARSRPLEVNEENGKETVSEVTADTDDKMHDAEVDPKR
jgi:hypothetical protein